MTYEISDELIQNIKFMPHTQKGSVMLELREVINDLKEFFIYMHEYYHVEHVIATSSEENSIYEELGMKKLYTKELVSYYTYTF